jgi:hypothetical protein
MPKFQGKELDHMIDPRTVNFGLSQLPQTLFFSHLVHLSAFGASAPVLLAQTIIDIS